MIETLLRSENIIHLGAALYLAGFLFRDQIMLRAFIIAGDVVYVLYFLLAPPEPLWGGVFWSCVFTLVNLWMIGRVVADRTSLRMTEEERRLFNLLDCLSPGEFRRLIRTGRWQSATAPTVLTEEGKDLDTLFFVLDGEIVVDKAGERRTVGPGIFIGEVAFLLSRPASATVTVAAGARLVAWRRGDLRRLQLRAPSLAIALSAALNRDMAAKVARA